MNLHWNFIMIHVHLQVTEILASAPWRPPLHRAALVRADLHTVLRFFFRDTLPLR